ncbi:MAG TPA: LuxR C-terminal-related transcriptional regulator [Nocardioidaceae bacterium]|nr:LuxR C-terminal-related transcriptional regulator [Nocardioidaceae bacterium]
MGVGIEAQTRDSRGEPADRSGRERELRQAGEVLAGGTARLVTFTGPPGVGKTWTARELKHRLVAGHGWRATTVHVDCARGFTELMSSVAQALGMPAGGGALAARLAGALTEGPHLLLLDRCEPLVGTPHPVAQLLELGPGARVLATSLRPLQVEGEHVVGLDPFPVPAPAASLEELTGSPAIRLFCRAAAEVDRRFRTEDADLTTIAELCRRVHGLPLGIEIMASRVGDQSPAAMVEYLDDGHEFTLQHTRSSDDPRHLSLTTALQWSYTALDPESARLLRRMSVFAAPATLDMLATVVPDGDGDVEGGVEGGVEGDVDGGVEGGGHRRQSRVLDGVSTLVDYRLADPHPGPGEPAFVLVDLLRDFAGERLLEEGEQARAEDAHTQAVIEFALTRSIAVEIAENDVAQSELARAEADLRATLRRLLGRGDVERGLQLATALAPFVLRRGYDGFVRPALTSLLRRAVNVDSDDALVARAELWQARLVAQLDGPDAGEDVKAALERGVRRARSSGDKDAVLLGLAFTMQSLPATGDVMGAAAAAREGVPLAEASGDDRWMARFYAWAGMVASQAGRLEEAVDLALRGLRKAESSGDPRAQILLSLLLVGLPEETSAPLMARLPPVDDLLATARRLDDARYEPFLLRSAAGLALREGDLRTASARLAECLRLAHRQASWQVLPFAVMLVVLVAVEQEDLGEAARFHGMVRSRLDQLRPGMPSSWMDRYVAKVDLLRSSLGEDEFEAHARRGEHDMHANALSDLLTYTDRIAGTVSRGAPLVPAQRGSEPEYLTPRELEVLEELITGATNKEISRRLGMAPKTVMHHSMAIYRKLGVRGRAEATAWAFRHGLAD